MYWTQDMIKESNDFNKHSMRGKIDFTMISTTIDP
jgi:hypothetical protein